MLAKVHVLVRGHLAELSVWVVDEVVGRALVDAEAVVTIRAEDIGMAITWENEIIVYG